MTPETQSIHLKVEGATPEVVIRHGEAEPIHVPGPLKLSGRFSAPAEFVMKRSSPNINVLNGYSYKKCNVIFNEKELTITLVVGEQGRDTVTVTGSLKKHPFLSELQINGGGMSPKRLYELIRFKAHYFADRAEHRRLVLLLQNFEAHTSGSVADKNDRQGNTEASRTQRVQTEIAGLEIALNVPLFEGYEPVSVRLSVEVEPANGSVQLFLVSPEFEEFYDGEVKRLFDAQRPVFEPFVIIEK